MGHLRRQEESGEPNEAVMRIQSEKKFVFHWARLDFELFFLPYLALTYAFCLPVGVTRIIFISLQILPNSFARRVSRERKI